MQAGGLRQSVLESQGLESYPGADSEQIQQHTQASRLVTVWPPLLATPPDLA